MAHLLASDPWLRRKAQAGPRAPHRSQHARRPRTGLNFLDLVSDLLDEYEGQFLNIEDSSVPLELLQYLVEENGVSARELGEILNVDHSVAARILKGERGITVEHAKNLGARFKVDPKVFLKL
jgi:antitoxin component HigA of HigAB toxin-antitoxin module